MQLARNVFFGMTMIIYLWYPLSMVFDNNKILNQGVTYRFQPRPVDPYDAFRGRFVQLNYDLPYFYQSDYKEPFKDDQTVYLSILKDSTGFAFFNKLFKTPPTDVDYVETKIYNIRESRIRIETPINMDRYFMNEKIAPLADQAFVKLNRRNNRDSAFVYVEAKVLDGKVLLEQLYMKNQPVEAYIRSTIENQGVQN